MKKTTSSLLGCTGAIALLCAAPAMVQADTTPTQASSQASQPVIYSSPPPDHYLPANAMQTYANSYSTNIYSPSQYPTAQQQYLQAPGTYHQQGGPPQLPPAPPTPLPASAANFPFQIGESAYAHPANQGASLVPNSGMAMATTGALANGTALAAPPPPPAYPASPVDMPRASAPPVYPQTTGTSYAPSSRPLPPTSYNTVQPSGTYAVAQNNATPYAAPAPQASTYVPPPAPYIAPQPQAVAPTYSHSPTKAPSWNDNWGISGDLGTQTGIDLGGAVSYYRYQEFDGADTDFVHIDGATYSLMADGAKAFNSGWFAEGQLRVSFGSHKYTGGDEIINNNVITTVPSTGNGVPDWMVDFRALGGRDYLFKDALWGYSDMDVSPYAGFGFRFLYDHLTQDSNGVSGYRRFSHYVYLPLGTTERIHLGNGAHLSLNTEGDILLAGWQTSDLGNAYAGDSNVTNQQDTGYGLRGSIMYETPTWSVGPYIEYWNINQSEPAGCVAVSQTEEFCEFEPHNRTTEIGLQAKYHFGL